MTVTVKFYRSISGYNPPDTYILLEDASDVKQFLAWTNVLEVTNPKYSIDGSLGSVVVDCSGSISSWESSIISIVDDSKKQCYIGTIVKRKIINNASAEFIFNIDWYTSEFCRYYTFYEDDEIASYVDKPASKRMLCRRSSGGEFTYLAEGFVPKYTKTVNSKIYASLTSTIGKIRLFSGTDDESNKNQYVMQLLVYHETTTNTTHWIGMELLANGVVKTASFDADWMWSSYCTGRGVSNTTYPFNSSQVMYFGYFNINPSLCPYVNYYEPIKGYIECYWFNDVRTVGDEGSKTFANDVQPYLSQDIYIDFGNVTSTEFNKVTLRDMDGTILLDLPYGITYGVHKYKMVLNPDYNTPSFTFYEQESIYNEQISFTISAKKQPYFIDKESVYNSEQRIYNQQMRSFVNLNQLASGLRGSVTEGAMMYAFSRNSGPTKGMIGGGVSAGATLFNYIYTEAYANKKQTEIEDNQAKMQGDTLLFSSDLSLMAVDLAGLYTVSFDDDTITAINDYHTAFGYKTNKCYIGNLVLNLSTFKGYIQADVIMDDGFRKEVQDYISKMFSYGIYFNSLP